MLSLKEILQYYPEFLQSFSKSILREYLQYKILDTLFNCDFRTKLSFLGGTALRIIYANSRFSEDLDFDNFDLTGKDFEKIAETVKKSLQLEGYTVEVNNIFKGAYRCNVRLPKILFENQLSVFEEEKVLIQLDSAAHHFTYQPDLKFLHRFGIFTQIYVTPLDILLSQKIFAAFHRKRPKGRDFYDIMFLLTKTKPNYDYLNLKIGIDEPSKLQQYLMEESKNVDFSALVKDVKPFLFSPEDANKITLFSKYIEQTVF